VPFPYYPEFLCGSAICVIQGKITDAETGAPIPFVAVLLKGSLLGNSPIPKDFIGHWVISDMTN
tara:strand:+ start:223 stop:414 length:192 start_codon:yes stop_codon:yes gene_type:complete